MKRKAFDDWEALAVDTQHFDWSSSGAPEVVQDILHVTASLSDVRIKSCDKQIFSVSKAILARGSGVFGRMFEDLAAGDEGVRQEDTINVDCTAASLQLLIQHLYGGQRFEVTDADIKTCLEMARQFDVPDLALACGKALAAVSLTEENLPEWMVTASTYGPKAFLQRCVTFAAPRLDIIKYKRDLVEHSPDKWMHDLSPECLTELLTLRSDWLANHATKYYNSSQQRSCSSCGYRLRPRTGQEAVPEASSCKGKADREKFFALHTAP